MSFGRRYAPFLVLAALQVLLIVTLPSKGPTTVNAGGVELGGTFDPGTSVDPSTGQPVTTQAVDPATGQPVVSGPGGGPSPAGAPGSGSAPVAGGSPAASVPGASATGSTAHCAGGRQYAESYYSPICLPKFAGNNGGATSPGVTADEVTIIRYGSKPNPAVDGVLASQGLAVDKAEVVDYNAAAWNFVNSAYELFGRKVKFEYIEGTCTAEPPDVACFRNEVRDIVARKKPFLVYWQNNLAPEWYDEMARAGVITFGGWHFVETFNAAHRPFHYDLNMGGTTVARLFGEYWCKKLAGKPARYAGDPLFRTRTRVAGILVPNSVVNIPNAEAIRQVMGQCGSKAFVYTYELNPATAGEQARSLIARQREDQVTTIVPLTEPIGPAFYTKAATAQGYFPEYALPGVGFTDYDLVGRLYDQTQWQNAFGMSQIYSLPAEDKRESTVVYRKGGGKARPHAQASLDWGYISLIAGIVQQAGPGLTPLSFERAALTQPARGGWAESKGRPDLPLYKMGPDDYTALSDAREVYWSNTAVSPIDGKPGAYVALNGGRRYTLGEWTPGEPAIPGR